MDSKNETSEFQSMLYLTPFSNIAFSDGIDLYYTILQTRFGDAIIAGTEEGICFLSFTESVFDELEYLKKVYSNTSIYEKTTRIIEEAGNVISGKPSGMNIPLLVKGTEFQIKVWELLLKIPSGKTSTYGELANLLNISGGARAVGAAVGDNQIAYLIPCHRVIHTDGKTGKYRWGNQRKTDILKWEGALNQEITLF